MTVNEKPRIIVATKADKLSNNELAKNIRLIERELPGARVIAFSSQTGRGRDAVWSEIETAVNKIKDFS